MRYSVRLTANFESNPESLRDFLREVGAPHEFGRLIAYLFDELIPNLESFPHLGREYLIRQPESLEGHARYRRVSKALGSGMELREYIAGDYLLLYAVRRADVFLLSIKHHRQLSFDLRAFWK
ncbi:MAG: type II toxin-antitoxin system RelE/ParE family toxin [Gammaproteobacteria bacterium]